MNVDWTAVGSVATAAAALITAWMAAMTRGSIRQTQRHHRDAFRPLVVFMPYDGIDPQARKELIDFKATAEGSKVYALQLYGTLQNVGVGPALNLRLRLAVLNPEDFRATCELSPMKAGEFRQARQHELGGPFPMTLPVNYPQDSMAPIFRWPRMVRGPSIWNTKTSLDSASGLATPPAGMPPGRRPKFAGMTVGCEHEHPQAKTTSNRPPAPRNRGLRLPISTGSERAMPPTLANSCHPR